MPAKEDSPLRESDCHWWLAATSRALPHTIAPKVRTKNSARRLRGLASSAAEGWEGRIFHSLLLLFGPSLRFVTILQNQIMEELMGNTGEKDITVMPLQHGRNNFCMILRGFAVNKCH